MYIYLTRTPNGRELIAYERTSKGRFIKGRVWLELLGEHELGDAVLTFVNQVRSAESVFIEEYPDLRAYTQRGANNGNNQ